MQVLKNKCEYNQLSILDGLELLNAEYHTLDFPFHTHNTFNIALILNTTFSIKLSDKLLKAPRGAISVVNPNEVHATPCDKDFGNSFFTYYISPEVVKTFNNNEDVFFVNKVIYDHDLFNELYFLSQNFKNNTINFEPRLIKALKKLISQYGVKQEFKHKTTRLFQSFINETSLSTFSLDKTSSQFGLNKYKFIRLFKQETGLTPNNYVLLKRIEKSKQLLKEGSPIFNAAIDSGFYDTPHFYRNFKRYTGVTPLVFQNAYLL
ncbi:AraC family transcriptional regulator [Aquimarina sediminis]|uniref:AraC family transcriptional regulator n=1 Tax=Aquimarina sediminis TaxID=2070536 RepID=UPI000CA051FE|nr:AraC family transcriptional regulator [Aquimarina sediminis]